MRLTRQWPGGLPGTFRDARDGSCWRVLDTDRSGRREITARGRVLLPPVGRPLVRPIPISVSRPISRDAPERLSLRSPLGGSTGKNADIAAFQIDGKVVYAKRVIADAHWGPPRFAIGGGHREISIESLLRDGLPPPVQSKAEFLARRIASRFPLYRNDFNDLLQGFTAEVLKAAPKYEPARGEPIPYMLGALNNAYKDKLRVVRRETGRPAFYEFLDSEGVLDGQDAFRGRDEMETRSLQQDIRRIVAELPFEQRVLAESLMVASARQTAERLGIHRGTVYRHIGDLRDSLGPKLEKFLS